MIALANGIESAWAAVNQTSSAVQQSIGVAVLKQQADSNKELANAVVALVDSASAAPPPGQGVNVDRRA